MEEQQVAKYISGLKYPIQEHAILHDVFSVDEAYNKDMKIERLISRAPSFKRPTPIEESTSEAGVESHNGWSTASPSVDQHFCISTSNNNRHICKEQGEFIRQV